MKPKELLEEVTELMNAFSEEMKDSDIDNHFEKISKMILGYYQRTSANYKPAPPEQLATAIHHVVQNSKNHWKTFANILARKYFAVDRTLLLDGGMVMAQLAKHYDTGIYQSSYSPRKLESFAVFLVDLAKQLLDTDNDKDDLDKLLTCFSHNLGTKGSSSSYVAFGRLGFWIDRVISRKYKSNKDLLESFYYMRNGNLERYKKSFDAFERMRSKNKGWELETLEELLKESSQKGFALELVIKNATDRKHYAFINKLKREGVKKMGITTDHVKQIIKDEVDFAKSI